MGDAVRNAVLAGIGFALAMVMVYVLVRIGALAWFRTRREHALRVMRDLKGED